MYSCLGKPGCIGKSGGSPLVAAITGLSTGKSHHFNALLRGDDLRSAVPGSVPQSLDPMWQEAYNEKYVLFVTPGGR